MASLNRLASNWNWKERERLNTNWSIIENYLSNLQGQINLLTGDVDIQELIDKINDIFNQGNIIIGDLETALQEATTVIANAQSATNDAQNATQYALNAIDDMQAFINQFGNAETYDDGKLYKINNIVEFNGSGFICIKDTQGNQPPTLPTKRNEWWQLFAQRGIDGSGSVSKVAGKSPEVDGNVSLTAQDVGAVSSNEFNEHLDEFDQLLSGGTSYNATLLNGLTGSLKYQKDLSGLVSIKVNISANNVFPELSSIANLPEGFRPLYRIVVPILNRDLGTVSHIYVTDDGAIILAKGYTLTQNQIYQCEFSYKGVVVI